MASPSTLPDAAIARRLAGVKTILLVLSGKGGVGKSSVSSQLALSLSSSAGGAARVGLLDIDLTGPSIPRMLGLDGSPVHQSSDGWVPVYADREQRLAVMSVGFLLRSRNDSVVWRGPKKNAMIKQFLGDVRWGELDYLIVDTPPGELSMPCEREGKRGRGGAECNERRAGEKERSNKWAETCTQATDTRHRVAASGSWGVIAAIASKSKRDAVRHVS